MNQANEMNGTPSFADVVEQWQKQLLQPDFKNNLLNFRQGRTAVRLVDQTPEDASGPGQQKAGGPFEAPAHQPGL